MKSLLSTVLFIVLIGSTHLFAETIVVEEGRITKVSLGDVLELSAPEHAASRYEILTSEDSSPGIANLYFSERGVLAVEGVSAGQLSLELTGNRRFTIGDISDVVGFALKFTITVRPRLEVEGTGSTNAVEPDEDDQDIEGFSIDPVRRFTIRLRLGEMGRIWYPISDFPYDRHEDVSVTLVEGEGTIGLKRESNWGDVRIDPLSEGLARIRITGKRIVVENGRTVHTAYFTTLLSVFVYPRPEREASYIEVNCYTKSRSRVQITGDLKVEDKGVYDVPVSAEFVFDNGEVLRVEAETQHDGIFGAEIQNAPGRRGSVTVTATTKGVTQTSAPCRF